MTRSGVNKSVLVLMCLLIISCSGTRHLPKGEKLYTGADIKFESTEKMNTRTIKAVVAASVRPAPNKSYLGMRPKLMMYMAAGENPKSKLKKWLKKTGEAPILISSIKPDVSAQIIDASLFNAGIFRSFTESKIIEKKYTARVIYTSHIHKPYTIKEFIYVLSDDSLSRIVLSEKKKSLIKPRSPYSLDLLKTERLRIEALLKNNGYFYFIPDYLLFKADTSVVDKTISLRLTLKDDVPKNALTVYRIRKVTVDQSYSLTRRTTENTSDSTRTKKRSGKATKPKIRPEVIQRSVYLRKGEIYSRQNHNITLNRLMSMGNFKFVQVKFSDSDTVPSGFLDVSILMTTMPEHTFRAEIELVSKSNNYLGPRLNTSFLNRNTFRGAELLNLSLATSFEAQLSGKSKNLFSYSFNPQMELYFPRFLVPFKLKPGNSIYIPRTRFSLGYTFLKRVDYFDMRTLQFIYGFKWKNDIRKEQEFNPINISYTTVGNKSDAFNKLLEANPFLNKSYEEKFIAGGNYSFTYNEQVLPLKKMQYFFQLMAETTGNVFSLAKIISGEKISPDSPLKIAGSNYSQYARLSVDGRFYYNFKDQNKLAMRFFAGTANPYGNSSMMPYSKQFFSGGPNSLRAFQINSVGPGTYHQNVDSLGILQLGGDVKLEMNAEYRFGIYRFVKGALFADAGNVWLQKSNPSTMGTAFAFSSFMKELAVGAGVGIRIDVSFFILRFDLAIPLRKPWLEDNHRWVINQIDFGSSVWRQNNLVLNIAIGYPF